MLTNKDNYIPIKEEEEKQQANDKNYLYYKSKCLILI